MSTNSAGPRMGSIQRIGGRSRTHWDTDLEAVPLPKHTDKNSIGYAKRESRPDRLPDGRLPGVTSARSRRGAPAAQEAFLLPGGGLLVIARRAHDSGRGRRELVPRTSLPHARHDRSSVVGALIIAYARRAVNLIFATPAAKAMRYGSARF